MGRRVGNFKDPQTGETHWLDVNTVKQIKLSPLAVLRYMETGNYRSMIEFKLDNIDMLNVVTLTAEYECEGKVYRSDAQQMNEEQFAERLAEAVLSDQTIDSAGFMEEMKNGALADLKGRLLDDGYIIDKTEMNGSGYVFSKDTRVMTIDSATFEVGPNSTVIVELLNCVGPVALGNLVESEIVFYSMGKEFRMPSFQITEENDGKVRNYKIITESISIEDTDMEPHFKPFNLTTGNDEIIDEFVVDRKNMLDDVYEDTSSALDDRFDGIF